MQINSQAAGPSILVLVTAGTGLGVGGTASAPIGATGSVVAMFSSFVGELRFTAGDTVEWSLTVCNDGEGGVDQSMTVTIR